MNAPIETQVAIMEDNLHAERRKLQRSTTVTLVVYLVLALVIVAYTTYVYHEIRQRTSPEAAAEMASGMVATYVPRLQTSLTTAIDENSDEWADAVVQRSIDAIPQIEEQITAQIAKWTDHLVADIELNLFDGFAAYLKDAAPDVKADYDKLMEEDAVRGFALLMAEATEAELDKLINTGVLETFDSLNRDLMEISKPREQLTKRQDAKRRLIAYGAYLADNDHSRKQVMDLLATNIREGISEELGVTLGPVAPGVKMPDLDTVSEVLSDGDEPVPDPED